MNPNDHSQYHLGISGGKDSTAALLWVVYESGWDLSRLIVTFCDTGNEDALTYAFLDYLSEDVFPIETIKPSLDFFELARKKGRFPSPKVRFCTQQLKIVPSMEYILQLPENTLLLSGVRKEEGTATNGRGDLETFSFNDDYGRWQYLPIYDLSLADIWALHQKYLSLDKVIELVEADQTMILKWKNILIDLLRRNRIPRNPLYDMGASRVGCFPCMMSNKGEMRSLSHFRPERVDFIAAEELTVGEFSSFFARDKTPEAHRTKEIVAASGEHMNVPTIRDVALWSRTKWGGKQFEMFFPELQNEPDEDEQTEVTVCTLRGACE